MSDFDYLMYPFYDNYFYGGNNVPRGNRRYVIPPTRENMAAYPWLFLDSVEENKKTNTDKLKNSEPQPKEDIDQIKKYLKADSIVKPITKANDGKFSFTEAAKNFGKGLISPITTLISSPENALIGGSMIVGAAALGILCPPAGVVMAAAGLYGTAATVGAGVVQLSTAKNGDDVEKAAGTFGLATFEGVTSFLGAKSALKYGVAKGGVKVGGMKATGAEAVETVNKMGFKKAALKTMDPRTIGSALKNMFGKAPKQKIITPGVTPKPKDIKAKHTIDPDDILNAETIDNIQTPPPPKDGTTPPGLRREPGIVDNNKPQNLIGANSDNNAVVTVNKQALKVKEQAINKNKPDWDFYYDESNTQRVPPEYMKNWSEQNYQNKISQKSNVNQIEFQEPSLTDRTKTPPKLTTDLPENGLPNNYKNLEFEKTYKSILEERVQGLSKELQRYSKGSKRYEFLNAEIQRLRAEISRADDNIKTSFNLFEEHGFAPSDDPRIMQMKNRLTEIEAEWAKLSNSKKLIDKKRLNELNKEYVPLFKKYMDAVNAENNAAAGANVVDDIVADGIVNGADDMAEFTGFVDEISDAVTQIEGANVIDDAAKIVDDAVRTAGGADDVVKGANIVDNAANIADDAANVGTGNNTMTLEELERIQAQNSQPIPENFSFDDANPFDVQSGQVLNSIDNTMPPQNGAGTAEISGQDVASRIDDLFGNLHKTDPKQAKLRYIQEQAHSMKESIKNLKAKIDNLNKQIDNASNLDKALELIDARNVLETQLKYAESDLNGFYNNVIAGRERIKPIKM